VAPIHLAGTTPCWLRVESRRITERIAAWDDPDLSQPPVDESGLFRFSPGSVRMIQSLSPMTPRL